MDSTTLRAELERLGGRIRTYAVLYGVFETVGLLAAGVAAAFLLDRWLSLPAVVRVFFLIVIAGGVGWYGYRKVVVPLRRRLAAKDAAVAVERRFEEFDGRLLSTLELEGEAIAADRNVSVQLVELLRAETAKIVAGVSFRGIFELSRLKRVALGAALMLVIDVGYSAVRPDLAGIFLARLVGQDVRWPQRIFLQIEFPGAAEHFSVTRDDEGEPIGVRIARGANLPVTVRARGELPGFVELRTETEEDGRTASLPLTPTAGGEWVGRFRNVREPFVFWAHDGDVNDDSFEVPVEVFTPPGVTSITAFLAFPEYTELAPRREDRGDVEAPIGTSVNLELLTSGAVAAGRLEFDTGAPAIPLAPLDASTGTWGASFDVTESLAYTVHLEAENGFKNLDPVTYAVIAVKDRAPTARVLEPGRAHIEVTAEGHVPLRLAVDDDFGIAALELRMRAFGIEADRKFDLLQHQNEAAGSRRKLVYALLDLPKLSFEHEDGARAAQVGDSYSYEIQVADNRATDEGPNVTLVGERRVDVVSQSEKMRLLTERQIRLKDDVKELREQQAEKTARLTEILADYEANQGDEPPEADELAAAEIGQSQITNRATRLCREFVDIYEDYLLNRIDGSAGAERLIPLLVKQKRSSEQIDGFDFGIYRPIVEAYQAGGYGQLDVLGRLLDMVSCILDVAQLHSLQASVAIDGARLVTDPTERPEGIREALAHQKLVLGRLDTLLEKMDEWEDFQEILTLFRDLLEDQRDLNSRTRESLRSGN